MKDDRVCLEHILECLDAVKSYTAGGREEFLQDRKTRKATLRGLPELAESTQRLSQSLKAQRPKIPWRDIGGFRNVLVHDYLGLNLSRIWEIIERDLPVLKKEVESILQALQDK